MVATYNQYSYKITFNSNVEFELNLTLSSFHKIISLDKNLSNDIDLVMIDGRFRVACCLKCFNVINDECLIAFDDFLDRPEYHIVLIYYEIVDQTDDDRMVILKKKQNIKSIPDKLIKKYELDKH
jgi:hypothetical protein